MPLRLRLKDPHYGVKGAAAYLEYWGQSLYLLWCQDTGTKPLAYDQFYDKTLQLGRDWWCRQE